MVGSSREPFPWTVFEGKRHRLEKGPWESGRPHPTLIYSASDRGKSQIVQILQILQMNLKEKILQTERKSGNDLPAQAVGPLFSFIVKGSAGLSRTFGASTVSRPPSHGIAPLYRRWLCPGRNPSFGRKLTRSEASTDACVNGTLYSHPGHTSTEYAVCPSSVLYWIENIHRPSTILPTIF